MINKFLIRKTGGALLLTALVFLVSLSAEAQLNRYLIRFRDKQNNAHTISNPSTFLSAKSMARRARYQIPFEETDLPITARYLDSIRSVPNVIILNASKWLNQVCIRTTDANALARINAMPFVLGGATAIAPRSSNIFQPIPDRFPVDDPNVPDWVDRPADVQNNVYDYGLALPQIRMHQGDFLHNWGFRGAAMHVGVTDAGFFKYLDLVTFDSIRRKNQIRETWDFVTNDANVNEDHPHGTNCFSTMSANLPGNFVGTAPESQYYLYRTEDAATEYPVEEHFWAVAAERADSLGLDVLSVSLGYTTFSRSQFDYTQAQMDGNTSMIARAADLASRKGMLVVVAAGNDGNASWRTIATPADADSVLTVGAVNSSGIAAGFSSYGPSADGQIKPDVAAVGQGAVVANTVNGQASYNNGTSFAAPIIAGLATCLWEAFPEVSNMALINAIRRSSNRFATPNDRVGYGIPDMKKAFVDLQQRTAIRSIQLNATCSTLVQAQVKMSAGMQLLVERKLPTQSGFQLRTSFNPTGAFVSQSFSWADDLAAIPEGTAIQYRLRMVIGADTTYTLDSVAINFIQSCQITQERIVVAPNPVGDQFQVIVVRTQPARAAIAVYAANGQEVYRSSEAQAQTLHTVTIPSAAWARGVYQVVVWLDGKRVYTKAIVR
jgi:hypothetical protein